MMHFFLLALFLLSASASDVVVLDESNFDTVVNGAKHVFVEFYAPWCGHCKTLAPEYEIVATAFAKVDDVVIASVDADKHKALGGRFDVKGFPTLKFFPKGGDLTQPEAYNQARTADEIVKFINNKANVRGAIRKAPSSVVALDKDSFDKVVDGSKHVLVEFYAPWCGHCKTLAPKYEELGKVYQTEKEVVIAKVDADQAQNKPLAQKFGVTGFPTLKYFPKGSTEAEAYSGAREVESFVTFLNEKAGTKRLAKGGLMSDVGRIEQLDNIVKELVSGAKSTVAAEIEALKSSFTEAEKSIVNFYHVVAKKFEKEGKAFIEKQQKRLAGLVESDNITPEKKDEFQMKKNVLNAFEN